MKSITAVCVLVLVGGCGVASERAKEPRLPSGTPLHVVSLDYCADQYVLKFARREHIRALSPHSTEEFSYLRDAAAGIATVQPKAEDVLILKPDLVVRSYGGGPNVTAFLERAGVSVVNVGWSNTIGDVMTNIERVARELGAPLKGKAVVADMQARLSALTPQRPRPRALYMTPAGVTTGPGSLVHEMLLAAGLSNFQQQSGWRPLPLEQLVYQQPDLIAASFFETRNNHQDAWSASRHPVARAQLNNSNVAALDGSWTACGGWFLVDAVETLARASVR